MWFITLKCWWTMWSQVFVGTATISCWGELSFSSFSLFANAQKALTLCFCILLRIWILFDRINLWVVSFTMGPTCKKSKLLKMNAPYMGPSQFHSNMFWSHSKVMYRTYDQSNSWSIFYYSDIWQIPFGCSGYLFWALQIFSKWAPLWRLMNFHDSHVLWVLINLMVGHFCGNFRWGPISGHITI